jgi:uncharacterized protein (DUF2344 family)
MPYHLSFDIEFPKTWKFPKKYTENVQVVEQKSTNVNKRLLSFACQFEQVVLESTVDAIENIIKYNLELEEKERLLNYKVEELKNLFMKTNLEDLQNLEFKVSKEDEKPENIGLVSIGDEEG